MLPTPFNEKCECLPNTRENEETINLHVSLTLFLNECFLEEFFRDIRIMRISDVLTGQLALEKHAELSQVTAQ